MNYDLLTALVAFAFVASITPGPNNLMLMTSGVNFGFRRTMPHMLGVVIGFAFMQVLVGAGLMEIFTAFPVTYLMLKSVSIAYFLFLAWKIATAYPLNEDAGYETGGRPLSFVQGALFQWVNPKAWAMSLTAISAYTPPTHPLHSVFLVALVFALVNLPSQSTWIVIGTHLRRLLTEPLKLRIFNFTAAALLIASLYPILFGH